MHSAPASLLFFALAACSAAKTEQEPPRQPDPVEQGRTDAGIYSDALGTVHEAVEGVWFILPENDSSMHLCFTGELAIDELKREGTRVRFSGEAGEIQPNVRAACQPFTVTKVEAEEARG